MIFSRSQLIKINLGQWVDSENLFPINKHSMKHQILSKKLSNNRIATLKLKKSIKIVLQKDRLDREEKKIKNHLAWKIANKMLKTKIFKQTKKAKIPITSAKRKAKIKLNRNLYRKKLRRRNSISISIRSIDNQNQRIKKMTISQISPTIKIRCLIIKDKIIVRNLNPRENDRSKGSRKNQFSKKPFKRFLRKGSIYY